MSSTHNGVISSIIVKDSQDQCKRQAQESRRAIESLLEAIDDFNEPFHNMSIEEINSFMDQLNSLHYYAGEECVRRIPENQLSKVEGIWYCTVTLDALTSTKAERINRLIDVLAKAPLTDLAGYIIQGLEHMQQKECRLIEVADADNLARIAARRNALNTALAEIQLAMQKHGGEISGRNAGLTKTVLAMIVSDDEV